MLTRILLLTLFPFTLLAQGSLLLVGGGAEEAGDWSDAPYQWAIEQAENKRVAIISFDEPDFWLQDYFLSLGADDARTYQLSNGAISDAPVTFDTLTSYDMIFIRGGDQTKYYETYVGTQTQQALQAIWNRGGVLGGTSAGMALLSNIVFTAEQGTVYPDEVLTNPLDERVTLRNDFLQTLPGNWIFDTHLVERGRMPRLIGFLANWYLKTGGIAQGIGVDDRTAFCIGKNGRGEVFGTAAVTIVQPNDMNPFAKKDNVLKSQTIVLQQLLQGNTYNFQTGEVEGLSRELDVQNEEETGRYQLLFLGSDEAAEASWTYDFLIDSTGFETDAITIISENEDWSSDIPALSDASTSLFAPSIANGTSPQVAEQLMNTKKFIIAENTVESFFTFINQTPNGFLLKERMQSPDATTLFVGDNARFAGKTVVVNYLDEPLASYRGELTFTPGLELLEHTVFMPNTFLTSTADFYENTISGLEYTMLRDRLKFGFWLNGNTVARYRPAGDSILLENLHGDYPVQAATFDQPTQTDFAPAINERWDPPRNTIGFERMTLELLTPGDQKVLGINPISSTTPTFSKTIQIYPNPVQNELFVQTEEPLSYNIFDTKGQLLQSGHLANNQHIDTRFLPKGIYLLTLKSEQFVITNRIVKISNE